MKNPYATHSVRPKIQRCEMADVSVSGLPMIDTEKSEQTKLNNMMFIGVHSWKKGKEMPTIRTKADTFLLHHYAFRTISAVSSKGHFRFPKHPIRRTCVRSVQSPTDNWMRQIADR
uniref:Uncharacterized protein n=1 Tax=Anopheles culicifacies TaxID=139723 RepID=A0A182MLU2_9DIPT